jgi:hypothetical protein
MSRTSEALQVERSNLYSKMKGYGLHSRRARGGGGARLVARLLLETRRISAVLPRGARAMVASRTFRTTSTSVTT